MNKKIIIILIGVCLMVLVFGLVWLGSRYEKSEQPKINDLCVDFELVEGEVSCQEAIDLALEKYPGEVESIKKDEIKTLLAEDITTDAWLINLKLKNSIELPFNPETSTNQIIIFIDRLSKEVKIHGYMGEMPGFEKPLMEDEIAPPENLTPEMLEQLKQGIK